MSIAAVTALERGIELVDEFFDGVFAPLTAWEPELAALLAEHIARGPLTGSQLAALVRPGADRVLDLTDRPLYGAGFCASGIVVSEGNPLAWWQGAERSLLASSTFGPGQAAIDLVRLEWYRVPEASGERHIAGPFVDYLCSNEVTITSALPIALGGRFAGVACADVLVASLEQALLPRVAELIDATLVNAGGRVVVSNDPGYETGDRYPAADPAQNVGPQSDSVQIARSRRYPFALITSR